MENLLKPYEDNFFGLYGWCVSGFVRWLQQCTQERQFPTTSTCAHGTATFSQPF